MILPSPNLIAPCGMDCAICYAYLREKNRCPGCRADDEGKPKTRKGCSIKTCENQRGFCYECREYPCEKLKHLDKRYRLKYNMSMIENLENIKEHGIAAFLGNEQERWTCKGCGGTICVHKGACLRCSDVR